MRIIAGEFKGRRLQAPKGRSTRPTTDRVRESLMSALSSARGGFEGAVVLDAFAGSGALGLEAPSRGAVQAHFFESDGAAFRTLSANVRDLGIPSGGASARARLHRADVLEKPPAWMQPPFDLVLLDPPYALSAERSAEMLANLAQARALAAHALVSFEHDAAANAEAQEAFSARGFSLASRRRYGDTVVDIWEAAFQVAGRTGRGDGGDAAKSANSTDSAESASNMDSAGSTDNAIGASSMESASNANNAAGADNENDEERDGTLP